MKRLVIFAGYDKDNIIDDYVLYYLKELQKVCDIIYVIDNDLPPEEINKAKPYCKHIIAKRHGEYDFGSYKRGYIYALDNNLFEEYDYLVLCNDSVYGPFNPLKEIFNDMETRNTDVWGMYLCGDSLISGYFSLHLQSYFVAIKKDVFTSHWYKDFIYSIQKEENKVNIITKYEIGMSELFTKHKLSFASLEKDTKDVHNRSHAAPGKLLKNEFPLLKIGAIRYNKHISFNIHLLTDIINNIKNKYDIDLIINHLNRVGSKEDIDNIFPAKSNINYYFISKKLFHIFNQTSWAGKRQLVIKIFNYIKFTINIKRKNSQHNHNDFSFIRDIANGNLKLKL